VDKRLIFGVLAVIIVVGGLYVFMVNKPPAPPGDGDVVPTDDINLKIITRHGSDILFKARAAFLETDIAAEYGITDRDQISFLGVSSSLWVDTIIRSGDVDIAWGGGPVVFDIVNGEGLLSPLESDAVTAILDIIPDEIGGGASKRIIDGDVMWVGSAISSFGFTINKEFLETEGLPEPTTWMDLGNETYAQFNLFPSVTAIGTADATLSTSNTRMAPRTHADVSPCLREKSTRLRR